MVSWKDKIVGTNANTATLYGGVTIDQILDYFSGVDLSVAGTDSTGIADIATYTYFLTSALNIWDSNKSHSVKFQTPDWTSNKTITFPSQSAMQGSDELLLKDSVQVVTNKVMDYNSNTFQNFPLEAQGFTSTSETTLTNKTIGDELAFSLQVSAPSDPVDEDDSLLYMRDIDASNNGVFVKIKKNGSTVEVQIA